MKLSRIFSAGFALLTSALILTSCSDTDDYTAYSTPLISDGAVLTGSSDVTATTATFYGTVTGLENANKASYTTGFKYGYAENNLSEVVSASASESFSATIDGQPTNQVIYYQAFVTLQGRVTYTGQVKSLITTNAKAITGDASAVDFTRATLAGAASGYPDHATLGVVIAATPDPEAVRAGLRLEAAALADNFSVTKLGLVPSTPYYYAAFLDLGAGVVYGDVKSFTTTANSFDVDTDFVDLGLSVKWAKRNIGATTATDPGGLYAFGDLTGVNPSIDPANYASESTYKTTADLAYRATGGKATLPTADLFEELFRLCKTEWTQQDGVSGYLVTGPNHNTIFLPAAGKRVANAQFENGTHGYYLTGSINPSNSQFAVDYEFNPSTASRSSRAVYEALSLRPVSTARNIPFDPTLLHQRWYLDNGQDGKQHLFQGPFTQWGATDTYGTVTNNEPNPYQNIHWEMGTDNGWIGYTYGQDYGYIQFLPDGTINLHRLDPSGHATDLTGHYTLNTTTHTITTDIDLLAADTWLPTKSGELRILSLTQDGLQIALPAGDDTYAYSLNYYSEAKAQKDAAIQVSLLAVGSDWEGTWGTPVLTIPPEQLHGQHSFTYHGALNGAMVTIIDLLDLHAKYPNALVRIDHIKLDGTPIKFDANKFFYGDIEDNGNFRVELFNIWGKGALDGNVLSSPFSTLTNVASDPAFTFANSIEVTFTIVTDGLKTYTPNLITINPSWGGPWDYNQGANFSLTINPATAKYEISESTFNILYSSADHADGSIMTFLEIADLFGVFPQLHSTLNWVKLDGNNVAFDASKVVDTNEGSKYRLELWNMYGATSSAGCGFGTPNADGVISELGFSSTLELNFTINRFFAVPEF